MTEENKNPFDLVDKENKITNISKEVSDKGGKFLENLVRRIAKMLGLPDPKAGLKEGTDTAKEDTTKEDTAKKETKQTTGTQNTTIEQDITSKDEQEKQEDGKKISFDSIMSGVTGVLKDIGEKVSEKTGIDLNNPLKKKEDSLDNEKPEANNAEGNETPEKNAA